MIRAIIALLVIISSCSTTKPQDLQVSPTPTSIPVVEFPMPKTPQEFLQFGFMTFEQQQFPAAIWAFTSALKTGDLNDRGRALCYWHIAVSYHELGNTDEAAEAFFFFMIVGQDLLEDPENTEFITAVDLPDKIEKAKSFVEMVWRSKVGSGN